MGKKRISNRMLRRVPGAIILFVLVPLVVLAVGTLQNDGLEPPFIKYGTWTGGGKTFDLEVAQHWERFYIAGGTPENGDKLRYFKSSAVAFLFGVVEKRDGTDAQIWWSTSPFDAGIYQQISGLTVGESYGFQIGVLQVYGNTTNGINNKMFRSVGIDPYGGTDPDSANVIWGPEEGKNGNWFYPGVGATAASTTMTVFVKVRSIDDAPPLEESVVWSDDAFWGVAPTTTLSVNIDSATQATATWSGTPRAGFNLYAYEAQYRKTSDTAWTNLQIFTSDTSASTNTSKSFSVEAGEQYVVRARTWHEQTGGDQHEIPGPWAEETITVGGLVSGKVLDNRGTAVGGVTISVSGAPATSTTSAGDGSYSLFPGVGTVALTATNNSGWATSLPISVTVPNLGAVVPLTLTLRPPDDVIANGDFTNGTSGWTFFGAAPVVSAAEFRTGGGSLKLTGNTTISQTQAVAGSYQPVLSFWYKLAEGDGDDTFTTEILGTEPTVVIITSQELTPTNSLSTTIIGGWQYAWLPLNLSDAYTGAIGVNFNLSQSGSPSQTVVYVDQVNLGAAQEASKVYLPVVIKGD